MEICAEVLNRPEIDGYQARTSMERCYVTTLTSEDSVEAVQFFKRVKAIDKNASLRMEEIFN